MFQIRVIALALLIIGLDAFNGLRRVNPAIRPSFALSANIVETAAASGNFKTFLAAIKAAGLEDVLRGPGPLTLFAPSDAAFAKLAPGTLDGLLKDIPKLKNVLLYHIHPGKMSPTRNGKTFDTMMMGEDDFFKQVTIKVTNWSCEAFVWGGQPNPAAVVEMDVLCDNGRIHIIDEVLFPYAGNLPPQITFIGARDKTGEATLQKDYYGSESGKGRNPNGERANEKFEKIVLGKTWVAAANWDFEKKYQKGDDSDVKA